MEQFYFEILQVGNAYPNVDSTASLDALGFSKFSSTKNEYRKFKKLVATMNLRLDVDYDRHSFSWGKVKLVELEDYREETLVAESFLFTGPNKSEGWLYSHCLGEELVEQRKGQIKIPLPRPRLHRFIYHDLRAPLKSDYEVAYKRLCLALFTWLIHKQPELTPEEVKIRDRNHRFFSRLTYRDPFNASL